MTINSETTEYIMVKYSSEEKDLDMLLDDYLKRLIALRKEEDRLKREVNKIHQRLNEIYKLKSHGRGK